MTCLDRKTLILIPAFNEEGSIAKVIRNIKRECGQVDILVINDGSRDKTVEVAERAGAIVVSHIYNMGYGVSLQTGYKYAVDHDYEFIIQMDADGQHEIGFFNIAIRLVTKKQFTDPTSGLQGLSRRAFTAYSLYDNFDTNYPDANIITKMLLNGYWLREVPAVMHERKSGVSMHSGLRKNIAYMFTVTLNILVVVTQFYLIKKGHKDITEELDLT